MAFWIAIAVLTAAATIALLAPIYRSRAATSSRDAEIAIYRDQLDELSREVKRGVLPESEAKVARNEIARRLLKASEAAPDTLARKGRPAAAIIATIVVVPVLAIGLYLAIGAPNAPDRPIDARLEAADPADAAIVIERARAFLADPAAGDAAEMGALLDAALALNPDEPVLWETATVVFLHQRRFADVLSAYDRMIATGGTTFDPEGNVATFLGAEILGLQEGGLLEAVQLFDRALAANPANLDARLYAATIRTAVGETEAALPHWQWIFDNGPSGTPLVEEARRQLIAAGVPVPPAPAAPEPAAPAAPVAPAAPPAEAAPAQPAEMVAGLAADLAANGGPPDRWAMLVRSYLVLGQVEDARAAVTNARTAFAGDAAAFSAFEEALISAARGAAVPGATEAEVWVRLILTYSVLGKADEATAALAEARAALAGNAAALLAVEAAARELQ